MPGEEKILVTGAGGFIGGWLAETLFLSGSARVRAGVHSWMGAARPARFPMEIILCDILNTNQIADALNGVSHVIHCAKGPSEESIILGTRNMLEGSIKQGVKRFIYISTTEVYGNPSGIIDESFPCHKTGDVYGDSKLMAENVCWEYYAKGLPVTVIRPPIVYGPFSKTWTVNIAQKLQSGTWGIFKNYGEGICNLIYISDLITGILMVMRFEHAMGEVFNLNGPEDLTWNEYFEKYNAALDLTKLKLIEPSKASLRAAINEPIRGSAKYLRDHFGTPIKKVAAQIEPAKQAMKFVEQKMKTSPRPSDFSLFNCKGQYLANKAREVLGFQPQFNLEAGLKMTIPWMRQMGYINHI
jgi:nucleoside-diphosphate-sugar epimerase